MPGCGGTITVDRQSPRELGGMQRACAAEGDEREIARIVAPRSRSATRTARSIAALTTSITPAAASSTLEAEALGERLDRRARKLDVEREAAREPEVRGQPTEHSWQSVTVGARRRGRSRPARARIPRSRGRR